MSISHIDHIAIATDDLEKSLRFFEEVLGLVCTHQEELKERGIKVAMLPIGQSRIELIAPLHDKSEISGFLAKKGPGFHHLALATNDVIKESKALASKGVQLTTQAPQPGAHGTKVIFVHPKSSGGVLLELVES